MLFGRVETAVCPFCQTSMPVADAMPLAYLTCSNCGRQVLVPGRLGGFLLHDPIGEGEMGAIYQATDESLGREVAVKLVRLNQAANPESRERLTREACAAGQLNHPRVAQVYSLSFSNGHPYLVMEWVPGMDFTKKFEREGPLDERTILRMALDVAEGLTALHREGLVHGDIKPANIVLDRDGNAKLVDFGLSGMTRCDSRGTFIGTPYFIAPELLRGMADTHQSDLYSLGATLYYLLSGRVTHEGTTPDEILKARLRQKPIPLDKYARHLSLPTRRLIMRLIDLDPGKRPADSEALAAEVRDALARLDAASHKESVAFAERMRRAAAHVRLPRFSLPRPRLPVRGRRFAPVRTGLIVVIACGVLFVGVRYHAFGPSWARLRQTLADKNLSTAVLSHWFCTTIRDPLYARVAQRKPAVRQLADPATSTQRVFTTPDGLAWQSMTLGPVAQRGSTLYANGTLIIQSTGKEMWNGVDRCRFVWTTASEDYRFSAQVQALADMHLLAITALLIKGSDPAQGPGLLFGFLGSGELFLQQRQPTGETQLIKCEDPPAQQVRHLRISRHGSQFEAEVSADGHAWTTFATCTLDLPVTNAVGFAVSPHINEALATAKFSDICLEQSHASAPPPNSSLDAAGPTP